MDERCCAGVERVNNQLSTQGSNDDTLPQEKQNTNQKIVPTGSKMNAKGGGVTRVQEKVIQLIGIFSLFH